MTKHDDQELAEFFSAIDETEESSPTTPEPSEHIFDDLESVGQDPGENSSTTDAPEGNIELPEELFDDLEAAELYLNEQAPVQEPSEDADELSEELFDDLSSTGGDIRVEVELPKQPAKDVESPLSLSLETEMEQAAALAYQGVADCSPAEELAARISTQVEAAVIRLLKDRLPTIVRRILEEEIT